MTDDWVTNMLAPLDLQIAKGPVECAGCGHEHADPCPWPACPCQDAT